MGKTAHEETVSSEERHKGTQGWVRGVARLTFPQASRLEGEFNILDHEAISVEDKLEKH